MDEAKSSEEEEVQAVSSLWNLTCTWPKTSALELV
jgi:hypothetical protein